MSISELRLIKRFDELCEKDAIHDIPALTRGIYALLNETPQGVFEVVYIGMAARGVNSGIRGRILSHKKSERKGKLWTHFSVYEVWDNITEAEIKELEGLLRHVYRLDMRANPINTQRKFEKLRRVKKRLKNWT
jgi:hypothetical protein